ncbi:MAG: endonuclease/exonuclease/phosphatase family protein, partial [Verrucomicrobiota bacterium]
MKKDLFKLGGFLLVVLGCWLVFNRGGLAEVNAGKAHGKEQMIRVVSWNLNWFPGGKEKATAEEAAAQMGLAQKAIGDLKPDLLLLQEVRDWNGAVELCREVPKVQVEVISRFQPRPQNEVLATNLKVDGGWSDEWKRGDEDPPRGYVFGAIAVQPGHYLLVYSVHLKSNVGGVEGAMRKREDSARQLLRHVGEMLKLYGQWGKCAVMICGDLNTHEDGGEFAKERTISALKAAGFRSGFEGVPAAERVTHPAKGKYGDACFDHIFTLGMGEQRAVVKGYPGVSDHQPVVMEVEKEPATVMLSLP